MPADAYFVVSTALLPTTSSNKESPGLSLANRTRLMSFWTAKIYNTNQFQNFTAATATYYLVKEINYQARKNWVRYV